MKQNLWNPHPYLWVLFLPLLACTQSPFGARQALRSEDTLRGRAKLKDRGPHDGIYVWMEKANLGTFTDADGKFVLRLSPDAHAALNGTDRLFFYVANYDVATVSVLLRAGQFVYGQGDVDEQGVLRKVVMLNKLLHIRTLVVPKWAHGRFRGPINVLTTLQATHDTVRVAFPGSVGGLLGGILFRNVKTNQVYPGVYDPGAKGKLIDLIGLQPRSRRLIFQLHRLEFRLPVGQYEVIPYLLVLQPEVPPALIQSLGENVQELGPDYLKIPFRRQGGDFRIID